MDSLSLDTLITANSSHELSLALSQNTSLSSLELIPTEIDFVSACDIILGVTQSKSIKTFKFRETFCLKDVPEIHRPLYMLLSENQVLEKLDLEAAGLDNKSLIVDDITDGLRKNTTLRELRLSSNQIGFDKPFAETVSMHKSLTVLVLDSITTNDNDDLNANSVAMIIKSAVKLTRFEIAWNSFAKESRVILKALLDFPNSLEIFNFCGNKLDDEYSHLFNDILSTNTTLTDLDVSYNKIGEVGIQAIWKGLSQNTTLKRLIVGNNKTLTDASIERMNDMLLHNVTLERLGIAFLSTTCKL